MAALPPPMSVFLAAGCMLHASGPYGWWECLRRLPASHFTSYDPYGRSYGRRSRATGRFSSAKNRTPKGVQRCFGGSPSLPQHEPPTYLPPLNHPISKILSREKKMTGLRNPHFNAKSSNHEVDSEPTQIPLAPDATLAGPLIPDGSVPPKVQLALAFCKVVAPEPYLDRKDLRTALEMLLPGKPSFRTIERWCERGLPFGRDPLNGRRVYLLSEVMAWYRSSVSFGSPAAEGKAVAREVALLGKHGGRGTQMSRTG